MTREEAIYCMTSYLPDNEVEHCVNCPYYQGDCKSDVAHKMAIRSLDAWDEVLKEVDEQTEIHSDGEFYIKNFDVKKIINKHLKEVEK